MSKYELNCDFFSPSLYALCCCSQLNFKVLDAVLNVSLGDTAMHLGTAMDELMRHQPTLKTDAMKAIIKVFWFIFLYHSIYIF